jgi:alpha-N-acetylglucosaminidase
MQGWLFFNAGRFWDDESVAALLQDVPNDKMMILDLFAEAAPVWKAHQAFHGKQWIVSTVTTWGGNNQPYGNFDAYSRLSADTLAAPNHGALSGFGISFEGSESNTAQFELLCDSAWSREPINVQEFLAETCVRSRYGGTSPRAVGAWKLFAESAYHRGFGIHPNHLLQGRPSDLSPTAKGAACDDPQFRQGVESLLAARDALGANPLYRADVEEFTANWALSAADEALRHSVFAEGAGKEAVSEEKEKEFVDLALSADRLLASHPLDCLDRWVDMARAWGCSPEDADYYEADAKRQVTVWGGPVLSEYAAKMWSGLIRNYYVPRWVQWLEAKRAERPWDMGHFEEQWITTAGACGSEPYPDPLDAAVHLVEKLKSIKQIDLIKVYYGHTVGEWHSGETTEAYADRDWALPTNILSTGNLVVRFQYTAGADRLDIDGVRLLKNGVEVARDAHFGRTGDENVANVFHLHLPSVEAGAVYTLRAKIRSAGGSDSNGTIYLHVNR